MNNIFLKSVFLLIFALFAGCANHLSSLNNNSSITVERGVGVGVGADPFTLLPRAYFNMGTNARIGKHDRIVITVNKSSTIITAENLNYEAEYDDEGKLIHEVRGRDVQIEEPSDKATGTRTTYLKGELKGSIHFEQINKGILFPDESHITVGE
jgi:hypothetical protein